MDLWNPSNEFRSERKKYQVQIELPKKTKPEGSLGTIQTYIPQKRIWLNRNYVHEKRRQFWNSYKTLLNLVMKKLDDTQLICKALIGSIRKLETDKIWGQQRYCSKSTHWRRFRMDGKLSVNAWTKMRKKFLGLLQNSTQHKLWTSLISSHVLRRRR